jgi:hypothetical protein
MVFHSIFAILISSLDTIYREVFSTKLGKVTFAVLGVKLFLAYLESNENPIDILSA